MHVLNFEFISNFTYKNVFVQVVVIMSTCVFCRVLQCHNLIRKAGFQWQSVGGHCCMRECAYMYFNFHKIQSEYNKNIFLIVICMKTLSNMQNHIVRLTYICDISNLYTDGLVQNCCRNCGCQRWMLGLATPLIS